jgi:hypothetical protein
VHLSKKEKAKDLVAITEEIVEWGFKVQAIKISRYV